MIPLAWLLKNWRYCVMGAGALLVIGVWAYMGHLRHIAQARQQALEAASRNAEIQAVTTKAVDQVAQTTARVEERTHVIVQRIQAAPGADTPLPADVRSAWLAGLSNGGSEPETDRTGEPESAVR